MVDLTASQQVRTSRCSQWPDYRIVSSVGDIGVQSVSESLHQHLSDDPRMEFGEDRIQNRRHWSSTRCGLEEESMEVIMERMWVKNNGSRHSLVQPHRTAQRDMDIPIYKAAKVP